jgi:hypothetical protein
MAQCLVSIQGQGLRLPVTLSEHRYESVIVASSISDLAQVTEDPDEVVARATKKQLEQNALYMHMKMLVTGQSTEISELRESNTQMHEENGALKERCVTLK